MSDATPFPYLDPGQAPAWLDVQRKQQLAQMLMGAFQQSNQSPPEWNSMRQVPKRGALGTVASLATALMAGKANNSALDSQRNYMMGLFGGGQPQPSTGPGAGIVSPDAPPAAQDAAQAVTSGNVQQPGAVSPPSNPLIPIPNGMGRGTANAVMAAMGPVEFMKSFVAPQFARTDMMKNDAYMGLTPQQRKVATLSDALRGAVVPGSTATLGLDPSGNVTPNLIPGLQGNEAALQAATTAATQSQTPHEVKDAQGRPSFEYTTPPALRGVGAGISATGASGGGGLQTTAGATSQAEFGKQGAAYNEQINADAENAIQGKRTLSEMGNLLQGFNPGKGAPVLSAIGSVAQAMGVPAEKVEKFTNMNVGDTEAFQKGTANLAAEAAKQMTNKVTQQEFKVYLANNPNWMMTPGGIKKAMDFMGKGFDQTLDKQAMWQQFTKDPKNDPGRYSIDFPAYYNAQTRAKVAAGGLNSSPVEKIPIRTRADMEAAAAKPAPPVGTIMQGHKYLGGPPGDPRSWQQVQ
jgi:hypothetical protein